MNKNDLPSDAPVGELVDGKFIWNTEGGPAEWRKRQNYNGKLYAKSTVADLQARLDLATHERDNLLETCEKLDTEVLTPPEYTREIGHAAERYFNSFGPDFSVRTPAAFRYSELWDAMSQVAYKVKSTCGVCDGKGVITDTENCEWPCYQCKQTKSTSDRKNAERYLIADTRYPVRTVGGDVLLLGDFGVAPSEDDTPFYDVEDEARRLCDELITCGMDRCTLQRALSKAYAAGKGGA